MRNIYFFVSVPDLGLVNADEDLEVTLQTDCPYCLTVAGSQGQDQGQDQGQGATQDQDLPRLRNFMVIF